jgi:hypothetical protein
MEDCHALLDGAIGGSPPSTVDIDRVVAAGRRGVRVRAAGALAGAALLVAAVLVGGALGGVVTVAGRGPGPAAEAGASAAAAARTRPAPTTAAPGRGGPAAGTHSVVPPLRRQLLIQFTAVLREDLIRFAPETDLKDQPAGTGLPAFDYSPDTGYLANVSLRDGTRAGSLLIRVGSIESVACGPAGQSGGSCHQERGQRGERIYRWTGSTKDAAPALTYNVVVQHTDGTQVGLYMYSSDHRVDLAGRLAPPLSLDQLVEIGCDPRLSLRD